MSTLLPDLEIVPRLRSLRSNADAHALIFGDSRFRHTLRSHWCETLVLERQREPAEAIIELFSLALRLCINNPTQTCHISANIPAKEELRQAVETLHLQRAQSASPIDEPKLEESRPGIHLDSRSALILQRGGLPITSSPTTSTHLNHESIVSIVIDLIASQKTSSQEFQNKFSTVVPGGFTACCHSSLPASPSFPS